MSRYAQKLLLLLAGVISGGECWGADLFVFTAKWCGPCRQFKKDLAADPEMLAGHNVINIDINDEPEVARAHGVKAVPTFMLFLPGGELKTKTGYSRAAELKAWASN